MAFTARDILSVHHDSAFPLAFLKAQFYRGKCPKSLNLRKISRKEKRRRGNVDAFLCLNTPHSTLGRASSLASFLMRGRLPATRAVLVELQTIRRVTTVLLRDVVTLFAHRARQSNLRADVFRFCSHCSFPLFLAFPGHSPGP